MAEDSEIGLLISNIVEENNYSHCRLCLEFIPNRQGIRFEDTVTYSTAEVIYLEVLLRQVFGDEVAVKVPGIDAVCKECLNKTMDTYIFIQQCKQNTMKLECILDNLNETLSIDIESNHSMYIIYNEGECKLVLTEKADKDSHSSRALKCKVCNEVYPDIEDLITHNLLQHNLHTCEKCMYTSSKEYKVNFHRESTEIFQCEYCSRNLCTEHSLAQHVEHIHKAQTCSECGKSFKGLDKLEAHKEKHIVKNNCPKCGKTYLTKDFFKRHVAACVENTIDPHPIRSNVEKKFPCKECGKGYTTPGGLRVHERFVHGNAEPHVCMQCGKKFTAPCLLKAHQVTHTKEKNFPCDLCERRFVTKEALLYHKRRHTGEKPYQCNQCSETFVNASARSDHIKFKHIGPTLSCDFCSKKFVTKIILRNHMKKHHDPSNKLYMGRADVPHNREKLKMM